MQKFTSIIILLILAFPSSAQSAPDREQYDGSSLECTGSGIGATDRELFERLNLEWPGLEAVNEDVKKGDLKAAKRDFVKYLRTRTNVKWYFDWRSGKTKDVRNPEFDTTEADKYASNLLVSTDFWHQFGPVVDWHANPTPNNYYEWTWQLSRHPFWVVLGQAYWATGDEKYARAFVNQMRSWVEQNPLPDNAANVPGSCWRTIETGIRALGSWPDAFNHFLCSPSFDDDSIIMMVKSFYDHATHLLAFPHSNNWLTMEMDGLFHIAMLFPEFKDAPLWARYSADRLYKEQMAQFYPDGVQIELSSGYHGLSVSCLLDIIPIARLNGYPLPENYLDGLEKGFQVYENLIMPDGNYPALNDSNWESGRDYLLEACRHFPEREDFKYLATAGREGLKPSFTSVRMPWAGWNVMRSGWDGNDLFAFMDTGPYGAAHQHEDKLSVLLAAYGRRLLTEGGNYAYDNSKWRQYITSARAHNVVRIDGQDQHREGFDKVKVANKPVEGRWISNSDIDFCEGWYDEGFGPERDSSITHYRALAFVKNHDFWLLVDAFIPLYEAGFKGKAQHERDKREALTKTEGSIHSYDSWFHFNSSNCVPVLGGWMTDNENAANLAIIPLDTSRISSMVVTGMENPEIQGWVSNSLGAESPCCPVATPVFHLEGSGVIVVPYVLCPSKPGQAARISLVRSCGKGKYLIFLNDDTRIRIHLSLRGHSLDRFVIDGKDCLKQQRSTATGRKPER